jgi:hypothetical protein
MVLDHHYLVCMDSFQMNYFEAMRLLDEVKEGINHPLHLIIQALMLTGDLDEL